MVIPFTVRNRVCMTSFAWMLMMVLLLVEPGSKPIVLALLLLSHQRDLQIGGPVFRLIKSTTVHVFTPIEKHVVVEIDEVVVDIGLSFDQAKQRKSFSSDVLHDIDFPRVEASARKSVRDSGKSLMQGSHLIRFIGNVVQVVRAWCNRVLSPPGS